MQTKLVHIKTNKYLKTDKSDGVKLEGTYCHTENSPPLTDVYSRQQGGFHYRRQNVESENYTALTEHGAYL